MQRRQMVRNKEFQQGKAPLTKKNMTFEELLSSDEVRKMIVEYIIFTRVRISLTPYILSAPDLEALEKALNAHYSNLLLKNIKKFVICKSKNLTPVTLEKIESLLHNLMLPKQKNDEWVLQYLAHFYSTHKMPQLLFYQTPFSLVGKKAYPVIKQIKSTKDLFFQMPWGKTLEKAQERIMVLTIAGLDSRIGFSTQCFHLFCTLAAYISTWFMIFKLMQLLPPMVDVSIPTYFNMVTATLLTFRGARKLVDKIIQSPFTWDAAGTVLQLGLFDEIDNVSFNNKISEKTKKMALPDSMTDSVSQRSISTAMIPSITSCTSTSTDENAAEEENKHKEKRKNQMTVPQSISIINSIVRIMLLWEDQSIEPLYGILTHKQDMDFLPKPKFSRAWSGNSSINAACQYHFFFQPLLHSHAQNSVDADLSRSITYAHVVPPNAHVGMVKLKKDDQDFPGARYKAKSLSKIGATSRIPLYFFCKGFIKMIGDAEQKLPENLRNIKIKLFVPDASRKTHT